MTLMTLKQAEEISEDFENARESWYECYAEAGMGAVSMGWEGADGMCVYAQTNLQPVADAEVDEARDVIVTFYSLRVCDCNDFGWWANGEGCIPEYDPFNVLTDDCPF